MKSRSWIILPLAGFLVSIGILAYYHSTYTEGISYLAMAATAQTPEDVIQNVNSAMQHLPKEGNAALLLPTQKTDFSSIQLELDRIVERVAGTALLEPDSEKYYEIMNDVHISIVAIQNDIVSACSPFC